MHLTSQTRIKRPLKGLRVLLLALTKIYKIKKLPFICLIVHHVKQKEEVRSVRLGYTIEFVWLGFRWFLSCGSLTSFRFFNFITHPMSIKRTLGGGPILMASGLKLSKKFFGNPDRLRTQRETWSITSSREPSANPSPTPWPKFLIELIYTWREICKQALRNWFSQYVKAEILLNNKEQDWFRT